MKVKVNLKYGLLAMTALSIIASACGSTAPTLPSTVVAPAQPTPPPTPGQPAQPIAGQQKPTPGNNIFANITAEQQACLKTEWGDEAYQAIIGFTRPPNEQEIPALGKCNIQAGDPQAGGTPSVAGGGHVVGLDSTYYATSTDGLTWSAGALLAEKASVPEVIYTSQGEYWAYWVDFNNVTGPGQEKLGIAYSTDGKNWQMRGNVKFTNDIGGMVPVDPDAFELPDGRLRMFFYDIADRTSHKIYSAVSSDGINFTLEDGIRLEQDTIFDPNVILLADGRYRMFLNKSDIISATSTDGLTFVRDDGIRVEMGAVPGAIALSDGSYRLYVCRDGISVYRSADGLNFTLEKKGVIPSEGGALVCDPSVTKTPNGYLMVYKFNSNK